MKLFNCILGVFAIFGAIYCVFWPGVTFLNTGWIVTVLLGAWGICAIFDYFSRPKDGDRSKKNAAMGVWGLVLGIAAAVVSVLSLFIPGISLIMDIIILYMLIAWFIVSGITSVAGSITASKKSQSKSWILTLILGILVIIAGVYGLFHLFVMAQTAGLLIGIFLMIYGVRLICSVFEDN